MPNRAARVPIPHASGRRTSWGRAGPNWQAMPMRRSASLHLDILYEETERLFKCSKASREICELRNIINVGYLIMRQAKERKESRGLHYTVDYPPKK